MCLRCPDDTDDPRGRDENADDPRGRIGDNGADDLMGRNGNNDADDLDVVTTMTPTVRDRSDELKHCVTNALNMALIAGFLSKDDHFEVRFFFFEISENTVEADCIGLVKTRWERRVKPVFPKISAKFVTAMHKELSSRKGNWKSNKGHEVVGYRRTEGGGTDDLEPDSSVGAGEDFEAFGAKDPCYFDPISSSFPYSRRARGVSEASASGVVALSVRGLLRDEAYAATKSKASERIKKDCDAKLAKLKWSTRIDEAVAEARDKMARGFAGRISEVAGLLAEIGRKAQISMLNHAEIEANLEFHGLLQGSRPSDLPTEIKALRERRHPIYDAVMCLKIFSTVSGGTRDPQGFCCRCLDGC
ncbi:hypothetical protein AALP_AAs67875U000200 [Arabis alpina]|uniref:Uncharacterized protein n=1 Tax=Arabis alpina TaxID=50452 RepID=A0A087G2Y9_ARAAL|nr:hypothetical protein AALP_AAs67875U000200 [Arabis alpina]